jgi:hypothetical protein
MGEIARIAREKSIGREECLRLLSSVAFVRVLRSVKCLRVARRVRIAKVTPRGVLLATNDAAVLGAAARRHVVGLQCDGLDADGRGWSVMVSGLASLSDEEGARLGEHRETSEFASSLVFVPLTVMTGHRDE